MNGIVHHAGYQFPILIRGQPRRTMLQAERNIEEGKAVGEIGGAVERIDIPPIGPLQAGAGSLFAINAVFGKLLAEPAYDEFFRCPIGFGHQVDIAFVFGGDTALEVATKQLAGLQRNTRCARGKTKIQLFREAPSRRASLHAVAVSRAFAAAAFADRPDLVLVDEKIGPPFAGEPDHGVVKILDPPGNALAVAEFNRDSHLLLAQEAKVKRLLAGFAKRRLLLTPPGWILDWHVL